jgi:hypothetical protein
LWPSANIFFKERLKTFAEGLTVGPRQRLTGLGRAVTQQTKFAEVIFAEG